MAASNSISVTASLKLLGLSEQWGDEYALERGRAVHLATAYEDLSVLDESTLDAALLPYILGYRLWKQEMGPIEVCEGVGMEAKAIEEKVAVEGMHGTLDRRVMVRGSHFCVDIKTGQPQKSTRWQTALYSLLWSMQSGKPGPKHAALQLPGNGKYRWIEFKNPWRDRERAKSLITAAGIAKEMQSENEYQEIEAQAEIEAGI